MTSRRAETTDISVGFGPDSTRLRTKSATSLQRPPLKTRPAADGPHLPPIFLVCSTRRAEYARSIRARVVVCGDPLFCSDACVVFAGGWML